MGDIVHGNKYGGDHVQGNKVVNYGHLATEVATEPEPPKVILLMSANPDRRHPLRLDEERREIDREVALAEAGHLLKIRTADAVRVDDLQTAMLRHKPAIVHFSGHGTATDGIMVESGYHLVQTVPPEALAKLFDILSADIRCVVLNACYTEAQARAIAVHIPCVVGMRHRILDDTAIKFAAGFYRGIAHGGSVRQAFNLGCNLLDLHGLDESFVPRLIAADGYADRPVIAARPRRP